MDEEKEIRHQQEIIILVFVEMTLGFVGIFCNLMVVSTIRDDDTLQESTRNLLLANIAFSNLLISFLVKPISAVYVSYFLTTGEGKVGLAFCTLYTLAYRTTWIVFPFSILGLCWNALSNIFPCCNNKHLSFDDEENEEHLMDPELVEFEEMQKAMAFPTIKQKCILGCIWFFSSLYGLTASFPDKVFEDESLSFTTESSNTSPPPESSPINPVSSDISYCTIRSPKGDMFEHITIYISIYIPTIFGPILTLLLGIVSLPFSSQSLPSSSCCSLMLIPCLTILHLSNYYVNLFLAEMQDDDFHFILIKYGFGFSFIILSPLLIIATQKEIRLGVKKTFKGTVLCTVKKTGDKKLDQRKSVDFAEKVIEV